MWKSQSWVKLDFLFSSAGNNVRTSQEPKQPHDPPASSSYNCCKHPETCPCTVSVHSVWSRWGRSRPSFGGGSTSPRAVGWGGGEAWRGWGSGCAALCSGHQSRTAQLQRKPLRGSSLPPRGLPQRPDTQQRSTLAVCGNLSSVVLNSLCHRWSQNNCNQIQKPHYDLLR